MDKNKLERVFEKLSMVVFYCIMLSFLILISYHVFSFDIIINEFAAYIIELFVVITITICIVISFLYTISKMIFEIYKRYIK